MPNRPRVQIPAIDGLRALAVLAVFLYHVDPVHLPGGFLGVDMFFVISGYLITLGLLVEWIAEGRINLGHFWLRRARRLGPAALALLLVGLTATAILDPSRLAALRGDTLAALTYVTNWYFVLHQQPYFEGIGTPSILRHLWSLAVEEQFYLLWPALLALGLMVVRPRLILVIVIALAIGSALLLALLYMGGAPHDRLYYGTDTRATALLIGAALAFICHPLPAGQHGEQYELEVLGICSLGVLFALFFALGDQPALYQGGLAVAALASAGALTMAVRTDFAVTRVLGSRPLRWLGLRSYSVYLWHWPVMVLLPYTLHIPAGGLVLVCAKAVITLAAAETSYRFVETPFRTGAIERWGRQLRQTQGLRRAAFATAAFACAAIVSLLSITTATARAPEPPSYLAIPQISGVLVARVPTTPAAVATVEPSETPDPTATAEPPIPPSPLSVISRTPAVEPDPVVPAPIGPLEGNYVTAIGDSVMLGSAQALANALGVVDIDAHSGRSVGDAVAILRERAAAGRLGPTVVVHVGNNGILRAEDLEVMVQLVTSARRLVLVNVRVPRPWESTNNRLLSDLAKQHPEVRVVDWYAASAGHEDLLYTDQTHLRPEGALMYASLIAAAAAGEPVGR